MEWPAVCQIVRLSNDRLRIPARESSIAKYVVCGVELAPLPTKTSSYILKDFQLPK